MQTLTRFLGCEYPVSKFPDIEDLGQRPLVSSKERESPSRSRTSRRLRSDRSPWIAPIKGWTGIVVPNEQLERGRSSLLPLGGERAGPDDLWVRRDDTFPSNLALFRPENVSSRDERVYLRLRRDSSSVRELSSGAIASRNRYRYGRFGVELQPAIGSGLITGFFLHRSSPRQEIDVEFLGRDTTQMLVNVFYNPGMDGSRLEFGYRGTPVLIDLGFDAGQSCHLYEIEWGRDWLRWWVDGHVVHERTLWNPTPIPDLPMELNVNLWHSRSVEFAGRLDAQRLPATAVIAGIYIDD